MNLFRWFIRKALPGRAAADRAATDRATTRRAVTERETENRAHRPRTPDEEPTVAGERGIASVNRARTMQSRVNSALAVGLMSLIAVSFLAWYYSKAATRKATAQQSAQTASKAKAQGEMPLPAIGPIQRPPSDDGRPDLESTSLIDNVLGPPPELPPAFNDDAAATDATTTSPAPSALEKSPAQLVFERRLSGPAFVARDGQFVASTPATVAPYPEGIPSIPGFPSPYPWPPPPTSDTTAPDPATTRSPSRANESIATYLQPTPTNAVEARVLPTDRLLLAKGTFIDCTLETAIDSTLPGMTTCITATDTFGVDGNVVLLERGTKLVGETQGQVRQGSARVFVLWTEARTPTGVVVPLDSPGTDALGRSGIPGKVNRHFWERFGAAILITVIDGAVQSASRAEDGGNTVIYNPSSSADITTEILRGTVNIPPTVTVRNGARVQVVVARDLDFRPVYELRPVHR